MDIKSLTKEHLFEIANISTGGYFNSALSSKKIEIETGGYGKRRLVKWKMRDYVHYFEINAEAKNQGWHWYSWEITKEGIRHDVNCIDFPAVVDYCDKNGIDIRNNGTLNVTTI